MRKSKLIISGERVLQAEAGHHHQHLHHHHHRHRHHHGPTKLFVFGDSYADTGNIQKAVSNSWKDPYGITFPGKPAGRFSDGRVLTDYIGMCNPTLLNSHQLLYPFLYLYLFSTKVFAFGPTLLRFKSNYYMI